MNSVAIAPVYIHSSVKRRKQTWYTIANGNWSDPNIWSSNGRRRYNYPSSTLGPRNDFVSISYPTANDDVYINHNVVLDVGAATTGAVQVNNLYVSNGVTFSSTTTTSRGLTVVGDLQVNGTLDFSLGSPSLMLYGVNNYVNSFSSGAGSTVLYARQGDQFIMDLSYRHLYVSGIGTKYLTNNLSLAGNFTMSPISAALSLTTECGSYNLTVNGTTTCAGGILSKTGSGSMLFVGLMTWSNISAIVGVNFTGNPTVECRGGITTSGSGTVLWNTGTNTWSATTNTQTWTFNSGTYPYTAPVSIVGAITLNEAGTGIMQLNQPIDCTSASGALVCKGIIYWNSTASLPSMTTGTIDRLTNSNTIGYTMGASITLPYTTYWSLLTANSGTKTALGNTSLLGNLTASNSLGTGGTFDMAAFNLTVAGTTTLQAGNGFAKTGAGSIVFTGAVAFTSGANAVVFNLSGNPTVEVKGGFNFSNINSTNAASVNVGTGQWTFSTNSQTLAGGGGASQQFIKFDCPILISGAIILTTNNTGLAGGFIFVQGINGDNASSKLTNTGSLLFGTVSNIMIIGLTDFTTSTSSQIGYAFDGSATIPSTTYQHLVILGTGTKTVLGTTTISQNLQMGITGNAAIPCGTGGILELSTYDLTVGGTTTIGSSSSTSGSYISKTGAGSVLFTGLVTIFSGTFSTYFAFAGNPTVECRGGFSLGNINLTSLALLDFGTGTWTFSTNNQTITASSGGTTTMNCPVVISGAITLTNASNAAILVLTNTLNGNNASSTFDNRGIFHYQNAQRPMLTGVLQTNAAANTFLYNKAGNQDILGGASTGAKQVYRTLTFAGSGNKVLQGYISIINTFTITAPAVKVDNGFTATNP